MAGNPDNKFDVTIVGAGPSGAILAYELARQGVKVLLLDKAKLPRPKVCAGGITVRASDSIPFDFQEVIENVIYGVRLSYNLDPKKVRKYHQPLIYTVMRDKFDLLLVSKACQAGATLQDGIEVKYIESNKNHVWVKTSYGDLFTPVLVGADGANSIVVQSLGLHRSFQYGLAVNGHVPINRDQFQEWDGLIGLDYGVGDGFTWIFPKRNCLSIGSGGSLQIAKKLRPYVERLVKSYHLGAIDSRSVFKGHLMPVRQAGQPISFNRVLLVGDAAGLIDPLSGEGIYNGVKSSHLAARSIMRFIEGQARDFRSYDRSIDEEIMPELKAARTIQKMNSLAPAIFFNLLKDNDRVWSAFCRLLRGERTYVSLKKSLNPPLRLLFRIL